MTLQVGTSHPALIADKKQTSYVRIALTGSEIESSKKRPPVNVAIVIDNSGSIDRESIVRQIESVQAGGNTALFAGVSKGAAETRKFLREASVNRVILLSDGQANVGPSSPAELESLGGSLVKEGISVSTLGLGLGYNEDLNRWLSSIPAKSVISFWK